MKYPSLKNPTFWLFLRFLDHNSRIRFYPKHVVFVKTWKTIDTFILKQKSIYIWVDKVFARILKTSFVGLFEPSELISTFFQTPGFVTFLTLWCLTSWKKMGKNWWSKDLTLQTDGKTNKAKFIGHFLLGWVSNSFAPCRSYGLSVALWWYILVRWGQQLQRGSWKCFWKKVGCWLTYLPSLANKILGFKTS